MHLDAAGGKNAKEIEKGKKGMGPPRPQGLYMCAYTCVSKIGTRKEAPGV